MARAYPAKLLLFGEYTIIVGGQALATPLPLFQGRWAKAQAHESPVDLQQKLPAFLDYLRQREWARSFRLDAFARDLEQAYYFASTIPLGYGAGSSGALCAAVYDRNGPATPSRDLRLLRHDLARMDSFFHGSSSGTDPLVCYLGRSLRLYGKENMEIVDLPPATERMPQLFLLDTQRSRETAPLVQQFLRQREEAHFSETALPALSAANQRAIEVLLAGRWEILMEAWKDISDLQAEQFTAMIPSPFAQVWRRGRRRAIINSNCVVRGVVAFFWA